MLYALICTDKPGNLAAEPCGLVQPAEGRSWIWLIKNPGI